MSILFTILSLVTGPSSVSFLPGVLSMASSASLSPSQYRSHPLETLHYGDCPGLSSHFFLEGNLA